MRPVALSSPASCCPRRRPQNSGHDNYVSLYLSCEPTQAEKERALAEPPSVGAADGNVAAKEGKEKDRIPWRRDGKFKFTFEVRAHDFPALDEH